MAANTPVAVFDDILKAIQDQTADLKYVSQSAVTARASAASFLPVAGAYTANDIIDAARPFVNIGPADGGEVMLTSAQLRIDHTAVISGETSYSLYLYKMPPPSALADNAAFDISVADRDALLCSVNLGTPVDLGTTLLVETNAMNIQMTVPKGGAVWGYLVTVGGFTATAAIRRVTLHSLVL